MNEENLTIILQFFLLVGADENVIEQKKKPQFPRLSDLFDDQRMFHKISLSAGRLTSFTVIHTLISSINE